MALWNFLNTGPSAAGIFDFSHNFHWSLAKLCDNIGYHGKSKCLLEYWNGKLASITWDNIFYLKLFKTFLCTGSSVQAERQGPWASCYVFCGTRLGIEPRPPAPWADALTTVLHGGGVGCRAGAGQKFQPSSISMIMCGLQSSCECRCLIDQHLHLHVVDAGW